VKTYPSRVFASVVGGMILGSSPVVFTVERLLFKNQEFNLVLFIPKKIEQFKRWEIERNIFI